MFQYPNIFPVDLDSGSVSIVSIRHLCMGDAYANRVGAQVFQGGSRVQLYGLCLAKAILADGQTVPIQDGQMDLDESIIYVDLPAACYSVEGPIKISVVWYNGDHRTTLLVACGNVVRTETGAVIDPGTIIPSVAQLIQEIEDAVGSIPPEYSALLAAIAPTFSPSGPLYPAGSYIWYDGALYRFTLDHPAVSPWTGEDVVTAEIGAGIADAKDAASAAAATAQAAAAAAASAVRYDTEQSLTDAQRATARGNIGAAGEAAMQTMQDAVDTHLLQLRRAAVIEKEYVKWGRGVLGTDNNGKPKTDAKSIYTIDYFLVDPGTEITFTGDRTNRINTPYFYDINKNLIGTGTVVSPYNIPENTYFIRFAYRFTTASGITVDTYEGGMAQMIADWDVSCVSAIEKAMQGGAASLQSVQPLSSPQRIQALDADGGENE